MGELCYNAGRATDAIPFIRACIDARPDRANSYLLLAEALADANRDQEMITPLETCIRIAPQNFSAHANLAHAYQAAGQSSAAVREARWCLNVDPELTAVQIILAKALRDLGEFQQALTIVQKARESTRTNLGAAHLEADLLLFLDRGAEVYEQLMEFFDNHKDDRELISRLIRAALAAKKFDEAKEFRRQLAELIPK